MPPSIDSPLSSYLRHQQREAFGAYDVCQRIDLICSQACHLAVMNGQPLHAVHILKAILHLPGTPAEQILTRHGLTLEKIHTTTPHPLDSSFDFERLFTVMTHFVERGASLGTEHLLLALLEGKELCVQFSLWGIDPEDLMAEAHMAAR